MPTLIHRSPLGALEIAGVPGEIEPGEPFDVDDALAELLLQQSDLYRRFDVEYSAASIPDLKAALAERSLPVSGKKPDLIARLLEADAAPSGDPDTASADEPASVSDTQGVTE